jgi:hypothetical protein
MRSEANGIFFIRLQSKKYAVCLSVTERKTIFCLDVSFCFHPAKVASDQGGTIDISVHKEADGIFVDGKGRRSLYCREATVSFFGSFSWRGGLCHF